MSLHQHRQRYHNIAAETTGDEMHMSQHYTNPRKRKVDITGQTAAVPHCCTVWETRIRQFEKDAYTSVLRAFKSQADSISWERESLITNLRKELRLSNDEHGEILCKINTENCFQGIRSTGCWESCQACGDQYGVISAANVSYNIGPYGNANGPQHKQSKKHSRVPHQPSGVLSALNQQYSLTKGRKPLKVKNSRNVNKEFANPVQHPSLAPNEMGKTSFNVSSNPFITKTDELANHNYLLGQKGLHALSFNFASGNDNLQWIDLTKSPTGDNQLENEDPEMTTVPHCFKPSVENTSFPPEIYRESAGRGICTRKRKPDSDFLKVPGCFGSGQDTSEIKIRMTNDLLQTVMSNHNVKTVFNGGNVNPYTVRDAKEVLKEHEKALIRVLESLADVSDDE